MAALRSRCGHYIFALWCLLSFFFSSPNLSRCRLDVCHTSTLWCGLISANLRCRSETCSTRLAENTGRKKSSAKNLLSSNISSPISQKCLQIYLNFLRQKCSTRHPVLSERELTFTFAICYRPSVCLSSLTLVRPTQAAELFGNISMAFGTLAIR